MNPVPVAMPFTTSPISMRATVASPRTISAVPSASSRTREPMPRPSFRASMTLLPQRLAEEVAESHRDEQRAARVLLHLLLDASLQPIEVRIAQPVGRAFHATGDAARHLGHPIVGHGHRAAHRSGARHRTVTTAGAKLLRAGLERVGEGVLRAARPL